MTDRPLEGRVIVVTRPAEQGAALADRLRQLGADVLVAPSIVVEPPEPGGALDRAIREALEGRFEWVVFTSAMGVRAWTDRAPSGGGAAPRARVAAVGEATADALRGGGIEPDLVPPEFTTSALGEAFPRGAGRVLLARADLATSHLEEVLGAKGWTPERVDAYRVRPAEALPDEANRALAGGHVDAIAFTSPSTVEGFVRLAGVPDRPAVACIGPVTAEAASRVGFEVDAVAVPHTTEGLVAAVIRSVGG